MRYDKLGRRIGYNWWRELIVTSWFAAETAWWLARESSCMGYATEETAFKEQNPRPTLKMFMVNLAHKEQ